MKNWIFLSKNGQDEYVNMFANGCSQQVINHEEFDYNQSRDPIVMRGILKHKLIRQCWADKRDFYYIDTGYFGNEPGPGNPHGWKHWHRIVKNDIQHNTLRDMPSDRWNRFGRPIVDWRREGSKILIAAPDEKPCKFYGIDREMWIRKTVATIKANTDRPIAIRERVSDRRERMINNSLAAALDDDVFALVTFNSVAATEAILRGIPAFVLAPTNAASPVSSTDLTQIDSPYYPSRDKIYKWACHLAYGQFHIDELRNGSARAILEETT